MVPGHGSQEETPKFPISAVPMEHQLALFNKVSLSVIVMQNISSFCFFRGQVGLCAAWMTTEAVPLNES